MSLSEGGATGAVGDRSHAALCAEYRARTPTELQQELAAVYNLLSDCFRWATERLRQGNVPLFDQWCFWEAIRALEGAWPGDDLMAVIDETWPNADANPFMQRIEALREVVQSAEEDA
jgi:hypothetical protein